MTARVDTDIAVVGAGIIGLANAFRLASGGREVLVIDPEEPGSGASYGNAGLIGPDGCVPTGNPDTLRNVPNLLFGADSPLSIRAAALPGRFPWLWRFLAQSTHANARRNGRTLAGLLKDVIPAWRELAMEADVSDLFRHEGCIYLYPVGSPPRGSDWASRFKEEMGLEQPPLTPAQVAEMEPALPPSAGGLLFPHTAHIVDPPALTRRLAAAARSRGASFMRTRVNRLTPKDNAGTIALDCGDVAVSARIVVLACGAWSRPLALQGGEKVPLDTERGYHIEFAMDRCPIRRPVGVADLGFFATPMQGRLRVAGTVELAGLSAPASQRHFAFLERGVRKLFPDLGPVDSQWLGFRPSLPDSLPVIGRSRRHPNLLMSFGHGHLGMTLAALTSRLVSGLVDGRDDLPELKALRSDRFW